MSWRRLLALALLAAISWLVRESSATDVCDDGFTVQPEDVVAVVGQMVQMDCQYGDTTSLSLDWEKDGTSILDGEDMFVHSNGTLQFNSVEVDDVGTYDCVVRTGFAQSFQCSAQLRLAASPMITGKTGPNAADSNTQSLSAVVTGDPTPSIEWRRNGNLLSLADSRITNSSVPEGGGMRVTLTITMVTAADRGVYKLVTRNSVGTGTESWDVPVNFLEVDDLQKTYNGTTSVTFTCTVRAYPGDVTSVSWMRGSSNIADQLQTTSEFDASSQHYSIRSSVSIALSTCSEVSEVVKCTVRYSVDGSSVEQGDNICQLSCNPPPITVSPINCTAVMVSWQPVESPVIYIHYQVEQTDSWQRKDTNSSTTHVVISGLMEGTDYQFRSSCNPIQGPFSPIFPFTTPSVPPVVTGVVSELLTHTDESFSVKLSWEVSADNTVRGYCIQVAQNGSWGANISVQGQGTTMYLYSTIRCGTEYHFRVAAVNEYSQGDYSYPVEQICSTNNIPPAQRVKFQSLAGSSTHFQPQATSLTIGFSLDQVGLVESFSVNVIEQDGDFNPKQILNYTIQSSQYSSESVCIGGLTPKARYEVCLRVLYEDNVVDTVCGRTETLNEDVKTEDTCQKPTTRRIESPNDSSDTSPAIPDWGIAVIVVGALVLVALLFCFLGLCFACQSSRSKDVNFGSTSSLQTERDGVVAIRMHNPHPGQRAMSPTRSCLKYNRGHSTTWTDHVDTLRQMDTDNGTSV